MQSQQQVLPLECPRIEFGIVVLVLVVLVVLAVVPL